jgi:hypothetical protein
MQAGFLDCAPLRALGENAGLLNRDLQPGDLVTVPDLDPSEVAKGTTETHVFVRRTSPPVQIRFVHGSPSTPYRQDTTSAVLNISNFRTTLAGRNGTTPFPNQFEFQQAGHDDPDTFKVEVVDPAAGASVLVDLEAMKPTYGPAVGGVLPVTGHVPFGDAARQLLGLECAKVRSGVAYRSRYLRLVVDAHTSDTVAAADQQSVPTQTLLVTDMADGNGTGQPADNDSVEILDQQVRASYTIARCPGSPQCAVRTSAPIGGGERQRLKMSVHIYRTAVGGATVGATPINEQMVRRRTFKWFRRLYAQANIGPLLVDPFVTIEDPPAADMLVISNDSGASARGRNAAGGNSTLSFTIDAAPGVAAGTVPSTNVSLDLSTVTAPRTPSKVADAIIARLPAGFTGVKHDNNVALNATNGSADLILSHSSGARLAISAETTDDAGANFSVTVARVNTAALMVDGPANSIAVNTAEQRRCMRQIPGADDVFHFYVCGQLVNAAGASVARGIAVMRHTDFTSRFRPPAPMRNKAFMSARAIDGTDNNPFSYPHEAGHVLGDNYHATPNTEMMRSGTSAANAENGSKRICDTPLQVQYEVPSASPPFSRTIRVFEVQRIRSRGAGMFQGW